MKDSPFSPVWARSHEAIFHKKNKSEIIYTCSIPESHRDQSSEIRRGYAVVMAIRQGKSLANADLRSVNLEGQSLRSANFAHADLTGANLRDADLVRANLNGAHLASADLRGANFELAKLEKTITIDAKYRRSNLIEQTSRYNDSDAHKNRRLYQQRLEHQEDHLLFMVNLELELQDQELAAHVESLTQKPKSKFVEGLKKEFTAACRHMGI